MEEKILQKLKLQRGQNLQVSDKTLEKMAKRFSKYIDTDEKLTEEDFTDDIENVQGNIGHIAKQVKEDTEKALKTVEKTPEQIEAEGLAKEKKDLENKEKGISPELAALMEQNTKIMETLSNIQGDKITTTRTEKMNALLKDAPTYYKDQMLETFKKVSFESDEDFGSYLDKSKTNLDLFNQQAKEQGLNTAAPSATPKPPEKEELNPTFAKAIEALDKSEASKKE